MYMDLFEVLGNLVLMVENIIHNTIIVTTFFMLFLLRCNKLIAHVIITVKQEIAEIKFRNKDEMDLYLSYHSIADKFGRYAVSTTAVVAILLYLTPMLHMLITYSGNCFFYY
ncbi:hypothetical protein WH47_07905 [Habropoda laboriosa]|uniref:Uncharacterized protein n=1 Tax=Habropoda laboriosa TaxID=597456 RepID=A0A0L7RFV8_9HYME|nr:hypothetical protein WH47_07905 [Habropoda laboriosa]